MSNYQKIIISISIILLSLTFTFKDVISGNNVFATPDSQSASSVGKGMETYKAENGEYPKWNPWIFSGVPSTHSLQHVSRFYPPNFVLKHLNEIGMPGFINYLLHFIFAGFGCFLILYKRKISYWASVYSGVSFALMPYLITMIVHGHGSQMMTSAYIPWIFYALDRLREKINIKNTSILSILIGFQLLRGHVQIAYFTWLIIGVYILFYYITGLLNKNQKVSSKFYLYSFIALTIGFGTAVQLYYPAHSYSSFSIRGGSGGGTGFDYATAWSFSFGEMLTFFNPNYYGFGSATYWGNMPFTDYPNYMGILTITLMFIAIFNIRNTKIGILFFIWTASLILSFGHNTPIYKLFYNYFPFFNKFRVPAMFLILLQFSTVILAGLGLDFLFKNISKWKNNLKYISISIFIIIFSFFTKGSLLSNSEKSHNLLDKIRLEMITDGAFSALGILLIALILFFLFYKKFINEKMIGIGILTLLIIDLYPVNNEIIHPSQKFTQSQLMMSSRDYKKLQKNDDIINYLQNDKSNFRILPLPPLLNDNRWAGFQIENVGGYHPAKLQNYQNMMTDVGFNSPGFLHMLNVKYLISLSQINHPMFTEVFIGNLNHQGNSKNTFVYLNEMSTNNIMFPHFIDNYTTHNELVNYLKKPTYSPINTVYINNSNNIINGENGIGILQKYSKSADLISATINMDNAGLIVFSEIFYPNGWECSVNNEVVEIMEVNGLLRGIYLNKGLSDIKMIFKPNDLKISRIISLCSFFIIGLGFFFALFKPKKND
ncbi:MAG: hypothetical protein H8E60_08935 [Candidatus Marinimicrobia bacterium]|nr:hypothetical protein [Candidatus Neomarinimicrobiota bacterium]